ncbi:MAG: MBL fold metallo-hydrolase [Bryobacteraceae bacterium]
MGKFTRARACRIAAGAAMCAWMAHPGQAQQPTQLQAAARMVPAAVGSDIKIQQIRRNVFMLLGDGANVVVQTEAPAGEESFDSVYGLVQGTGLMVIDTGTAAMSDRLLATIRTLSKGPIRYIINTSADPDHVGGNEALAKISGGIVRGALGGRPAGPPLMILAHETVLERMGAPSGQQAAYTLDAWPTDVYAKDKEVFFNGGSTKIVHQPDAHSDGDSIVFLRRSDVIAAGELFSTVGFPKIDAAKGGHIRGVIGGLQQILEMAIPGELQQGGTMIVPAHGRLSDEADVEFYREMVQIVHDRIEDGIKNGQTLEQVKAARPALEYEKRYSQPDWTADMFVEAVYKDLAASMKPLTKPAVPAKR